MKRIAAAAAALAFAPALARADASTWNIDPAHTMTGFSVKHLVISTVRGEFEKTAGVLRLDDKDVTKSSVEATIDATTVNTRISDRDNHLESPDFFDVARYPTITFKSTKVVKAGDHLQVTGDLTMKGVTRPVTLKVTGPTPAITDPWGKQRRGIQATGKISRKDFGLLWNKVVEAGPVVGDEVAIEIDAEVVKAQ